MVAGNVLVVFHHLVDNAVGSEFDDTVGYGFDKLVVMAGEQDVAFEQLQVVVESLDAFQIQMICRGVQNETVGVFQLHAGYHTTHLLSSRKHVDFLHYLFSREQHSSEEALEVNFVAFTELAQPIHKVQIAFEETGVVERQICRSNGHSPFVVASLCFTVTVDDFKKAVMARGSRLRKRFYLLFLR